MHPRPSQGRLAFYLDLHAHANKRGVFAFGNHIPEDPAKQIEGLMYAQLCALNCPHVSATSSGARPRQ